MESNARGRVRRIDRDLDAIGRLTQAVLDGDDLEGLLARVAGEARALVGAISGVVVTVDRASSLMTFRAVAGLSVGPLRVGHVMPVTGTLTELALIRDGNLVVRSAAEIPAAGRAFAIATGTGPLVAAPLASVGPASGVLLVARSAEARQFNRTDVAVIATFAAQAASAIQLFELRSSEAGYAAHVERQRIARDLHHGVIQALRDLEVGVRALETPADPVLTTGIRSASDQLAEAIETVGAYIDELGRDTDGAARRTAAVDDSQPVAWASAEPPAESVGGRSRRDRRPAASLPSRPGPVKGDAGAAATIAVMGDLARAAAGDAPTTEVLDWLVQEVVDRVGGVTGQIGTLTDDGKSILVRSKAGIDLPGRRAGDRIPVAQTGAGQAILAGQPIVATSATGITPDIPPVIADRVGPTVAVPLVIRARRFGALAVSRPPEAEPFGPGDVRLIEAYGVQAAIALEFERVRADLRRASVSLERERIGRDLHERIVQLLFGAAFTLQALESGVRDEAIRSELQAAVHGLDRAIRDLRRFVLDLGPGTDVTPADERLDALTADNARLQAEIEAQLAEVRASRVRIIAAGDAERKRVERDLHDGAQQRLVSLTLALRLARSQLGDELDPAARLSLDQAAEEAKAALAELRELARGIHPQILTEAGLRPAVESLAARSSVDIRIEMVDARFSTAVEGAAYFTISEALANVSKYASAHVATVRVDQHDDHVLVEITDDGVGGADPSSGTGLRGLTDRLASLNGTLEIRSPLGGGTRLRAWIPVGAEATATAVR